MSQTFFYPTHLIKTSKTQKPKKRAVSFFLFCVSLPTLSDKVQSVTGTDITLEEVKSAIRDLQSGKSPEEDDLPVEF